MGFIWERLLVENPAQVNHRLHGSFSRVMLWPFPSKTPLVVNHARLSAIFLRGVSI
jgi:hypothetical protein